MVQATILFMVGLILICIGGDRLVDAAVAIARKLGIPQIVVGATIVSLGTTLPEVLVSTTAAFDGSAAIAAGNAFGSIICNTALIAGLTQTIRPTKKVEVSSLLWRSGFFFAVLIAMNVYGYVTGAYGRPVGIMLLLLFGLYAYLNIRRSGSEGEDSQEEEKNQEVSVPRQLLVLVICAGLLYLGANLLVDNGIFIANAIGVPERVIAVTFIALGTSLPELVTSIVSLIKGYGNVGLGNVIGANILNLLLVIGIPAAVEGIPLERSTVTVDMPLSLLVMAILLVPILVRKRSSRVQGAALLCIYVAYCILSFAQ
ncbi:MAG: calcium/sodium antiporter [Lachnospiraceae bacterium]|nr:calcium/sodium antiporter [Lachnospiraceae bacterium]